MQSKIFSVFDNKMKIFMTPLIMRNEGEALRLFVSASNDESTTICKYPEDYTLFELGVWDDEKGTIEMYPSPVSLGIAASFKRPTLV